MKEIGYGFFGIFLFFLLIGLLEKWNLLDPILDFLGVPK